MKILTGGLLDFAQAANTHYTCRRVAMHSVANTITAALNFRFEPLATRLTYKYKSTVPFCRPGSK